MQIYRTTNLINGKWYIGKDEGSRDYYLGSGKALTNAVRKYGKHNFKKEILEVCETREQLIEREKHWIAVTNAQTDKMSYNIAAGGEGGDWTSWVSSEEAKAIYKKRGYHGDYLSAAIEWRKNLSSEELDSFYKKQAQKRCKGWYVSKVEQPEIEEFVLNINEWCKAHGIDTGHASIISNPKKKLYGSAAKGWRVRRAGDPPLPEFKDGRKQSRPNIACKGRSWKLIDGKRVWFNKEE